jgi:hypothetical protein
VSALEFFVTLTLDQVIGGSKSTLPSSLSTTQAASPGSRTASALTTSS